MRDGQKDDQNGGDEENRTPDPLLARQVLSQLSYTPMWCFPFDFGFALLRSTSVCRGLAGVPPGIQLRAILPAASADNFSQVVRLNERRVRWYASERKCARCGKFGGPKWTRTTDLTLIRRAL